MATPIGGVRTGRTSMGTHGGWPVARLLAMVGGIIGLIVAVMTLAGAAISENFVAPGYSEGMAGFMQNVAGSLGVVHLVMGLLVVASAYLVLNNPRVHGGLLTLWGVLGILTGFGLFIGAVMVVVGGVMALMGRGLEQTGRSGGMMGRRTAL